MWVRGRRTGDRLRWLLRPRSVFLAVLALLAAGGCRATNNKSSLVEAELRTREREVRAMRTELDRAVTFNEALQNELLSRRPDFSAPCPPTGAIIDGPQAVMSGMIKGITLGRGTGGLDDDGWPGDEALQVVLVPQDVDGSAMKVPGTATVQAFEITSEGLKIPLARWDVSALQIQKSWRSGIFSTGYYLVLPWKTFPRSEKLRVVAQFFTLPNNRPFEVDKDVNVKLVANAPRAGAGIPPAVEIAPPKIIDGPILPSVPGLPGTNEQLPPPIEGPILTPGAWLRRTSPESRVEAAKPAPARQPVRLLGPQSRPDDGGSIDDS